MDTWETATGRTLPGKNKMNVGQEEELSEDIVGVLSSVRIYKASEDLERA